MEVQLKNAEQNCYNRHKGSTMLHVLKDLLPKKIIVMVLWFPLKVLSYCTNVEKYRCKLKDVRAQKFYDRIFDFTVAICFVPMVALSCFFTVNISLSESVVVSDDYMKYGLCLAVISIVIFAVKFVAIDVNPFLRDFDDVALDQYKAYNGLLLKCPFGLFNKARMEKIVAFKLFPFYRASRKFGDTEEQMILFATNDVKVIKFYSAFYDWVRMNEVKTLLRFLRNIIILTWSSIIIYDCVFGSISFEIHKFNAISLMVVLALEIYFLKNKYLSQLQDLSFEIVKSIKQNKKELMAS
jgi:hypothetical protein